MEFRIKNMVCDRCKMAVQKLLEQQGLHPTQVELGHVVVQESTIEDSTLQHIKHELQQLGFELLQDRTTMLIEKIKNLVVEQIHYSDERVNKNFSNLISEAVHYDYTYLSKLFSETVGISIGQFIILQKIERAKELIAYDELTLSQIADQLHYSSVAHLSNQFKKITGVTPSQFKNESKQRRSTLDNI